MLSFLLPILANYYRIKYLEKENTVMEYYEDNNVKPFLNKKRQRGNTGDIITNLVEAGEAPSLPTPKTRKYIVKILSILHQRVDFGLIFH